MLDKACATPPFRPMKGIVWVLAIVLLACVKMVTGATPPAVRSAWWTLTTFAVNLLDILVIVVAWRLARRYPIGRTQPLRNIGPHALAAAAYSIAEVVFSRLSATGVDLGNTTTEPSVLGQAFGNVVAYAVWAVVVHGVEYLRRYRASQTAELRLRTELAEVGRRRVEAELRALKAELNPHLIGSALSEVSSRIRPDPRAAERAIAELGDMLRAAISRSGTQEVTLGEEIDGLAPFLAVLRGRFADRIEVTYQVEEDARDARVPHMILQPLIETAVHARENRADIRITAARVGQSREKLRIEVHNAAVNSRSDHSASAAGNASLANVEARLREVYGTHAALETATLPDGGSLGRLTLPWREEEDEGQTAEASPPTQPAQPMAKSGSRAWALPLLLTIWFLAIHTVTAQFAFTSPLRSGLRVPLVGALVEGFFNAAVMTAMLYVAIRITRNSPRSPDWRKHGMAAIALGLGSSSTRAIIFLIMGAPYVMPEMGHLISGVVAGAFWYGILVAIVHSVAYARRYRGTEAAGLRLRAELADAGQRRAEAVLRALKLELNPHFLGNALSAASSLVRTDPAAAERVLAQLGETLRVTVSRAGSQEVTLREEIEGLAPFLAIERARFGDRLAFSLEVDDDVREAHVPHMILQPLVENAVKHGLSARGAGRIVVAGRRAGEQLELSVRDDGVGMRNAQKVLRDRPGGVGLANTRARLEQLYGADARFDLVAAPDNGTIARLTLPWR